MNIFKKEKINKLFLWLMLLFSQYQPSYSQIIVDGKSDDWPNPLNFYSTDAHLFYSFSNNDSVLFVCIKIVDQKFQMKAIEAGMLMVIDTTGKKMKSIKINYPIGRNPNMEKNKKVKVQPTTVFSDSILQENKKYFISGFKSENGEYSTDNDKNIFIKSSISNSKEMIIEYSIPLRLFFHVLTNHDNKKKISISIILNGLPVPDNENFPMPPTIDGFESPPTPPRQESELPNFEEMEKLMQTQTINAKYLLIKK